MRWAILILWLVALGCAACGGTSSTTLLNPNDQATTTITGCQAAADQQLVCTIKVTNAAKSADPLTWQVAGTIPAGGTGNVDTLVVKPGQARTVQVRFSQAACPITVIYATDFGMTSLNRVTYTHC